MHKKLVSIVIMIALISSMSFVTVFAETVEEDDVFCCEPLDDIGYRQSVPDSANDAGFALELPESYDPRKTNATTTVKNQRSLGVCATFASCATLEAKIYEETGLKENISEEAVRYVISSYTNKYLGVNNDIGVYIKSEKETKSGVACAAYLSQRNSPVSDYISWVSPNLTSDIPYTVSNDYASNCMENINTSYSTNYAGNIKYVNFEDIKSEVYENGAAYITFNANFDYLNEETGAFYSPELVGNCGHAVALIGWDDDYPKENFKKDCMPENDGAFLIKNSWGENWGDGGYGWISYEDVTFGCCDGSYVVEDLSPVSKNEYSLSYDYLPITAEVYSNNTECSRSVTAEAPYVCMANVYDVSDLTNDYGKIDRVTFYAKDIGDFYQVYIAPVSIPEDSDSVSMPSINDLGGSLASGTVNYEGYITADLKNNYKLDENTGKIAVIVKFNTDYISNKTITLCRERLIAGHYNPIAYKNESFVYCNGKWSDSCGSLTESNCGNYCIRPTLVRRTEITENSTLSTNELRYKGKDLSVDINLNGNLLYSIKNNGSVTLYEDNQFTRSGNTVTFKKSFLDSLSTDSPSEIVFNFTDGDSQTLTILPKHSAESVNISGYSVVDGELTAVINADDGDDVNYNDLIDYQWYTSSDGESWSEISGADSRTYTPDEDDMLNYLRVEVSTAESVYLANSESAVCSESCRVYLCGDVNCNGNVDVDDATEMQKVLAELIESSDSVEVAGDVNQDGYLNIDDVTNIQKYIAGIKKSLPVK